MDDLKLIKRHYGEKMMHLCRELFPTLLETPGLLFSVLSNTFAYSRHLYDDIIEDDYVEIFKNFIYNKADTKKASMLSTKKTAKELLDEAGYILYECHSEEDIQSFKKYYAPGEELCTFGGDRLDRCHVFFAVKKNVDEIKRKKFEHPVREDEYGTSVISIQFSRGSCNTLSIKNRYNHTVRNPDATFSNNLENIIPGLTAAFEQDYNLNINSVEATRELEGYVLAKDGRYYKYSYERNNIYYCPNNIIVDNFEAIHFDESRYIVFEVYVLDMKEKKLFQYDEWSKTDYYIGDDSFPDTIDNIESIEVLNNKNNNTKDIIINKDIIITLNETNGIISYKNPHVKQIGEYFLYLNEELKELDLPNVESIGDYFLFCNGGLKEFVLPKVEEIGNYCICSNSEIMKIDLPSIKRVGDSFINIDVSIEEINLPTLEEAGSDFIHDGKSIKKVNLPKLVTAGNGFLALNRELKTIDLPSLTVIGNNTLLHNKKIKKVSIPNVKTIGNEFLFHAQKLEKLDAPNVEIIGNRVLQDNQKLKELILPNCKKIGNYFMEINNSIEVVNLPNVEHIGDYFFRYNNCVRELYLPKCITVEDQFMIYNNVLLELDLPSMEIIGESFLEANEVLNRITAPKLKELGAGFLLSNKALKEISLPRLEEVDRYCLHRNKVLEKIDLPSLKDNYYDGGIIELMHELEKKNKSK